MSDQHHDDDQSDMSADGNEDQMVFTQEMEDLSEEQIVATILDLGNQIWGNMGFEEPIQDASVFFRDQFYMQFFMSAFPDSDFSELVETDDEEVMAGNIQALIDMLSQKILMYDLEHIKGDQIVGGNPEHCINLLQLAKEISCMMNSNSNELDPNQMQNDEEEDESEQEAGEFNQQDLYAMKQQLELEEQEAQQMDEDGYSDEGDGNWKDQEDMHLMNDLGAQMAGVDIDDNNDDDIDDQGVSMDVVDYDDIEVHLEGDDDEMNLQDGHQQHQQLDQLEDDDEEDQYKDEDDQDPDNEVSINLEDAIATAEEINSRERNIRNNDNETSSDDDQGGSGSGPYRREDAELESAEAIAGIVTDGHNEKDGFDQMREEQLHRQRMVRQADEYGAEDDESAVYDEEDDVQDGQLEDHHQGDMMHQDVDDIEGEEEDEMDGDQEGEDMQMNIHPDLIAAAHKMGVDLDSEQIHELQKFIEQQNLNLDENEESEADMEGEDDSMQQIQKSEQMESQGQQSSSDDSSKKNKKKKESSSSSSSSHHNKKQSSNSSSKSSEKHHIQQHEEDQNEEQSQSQDEEAYEYLQQEQQRFHQQEDDDEDGEDNIEDEDNHPDDEDEEQAEEDENQQENGGEDEEDKLQLDVDDLNEHERQLLVAYLQEEYEKNPDTFQIPKEKLQELINAQVNKREQDDEQDDEYGIEEEDNMEQQNEDNDGQQEGIDQDDEDQSEQIEELTDEQQEELLLLQQQAAQMQGHNMMAQSEAGVVMDDDQDENQQEDEDELDDIEGGGQQIEEDDFPTEQEMIDQQLTQEQIEQVMLLKQQQQMQQQQQMYEQVDEESEGGQNNQHQMHQIYQQLPPKAMRQGKRKATKQGYGMANQQNMIASSKYSQARGRKGLGSKGPTMGNTAESMMHQEANPLQRLMQAPPKNNNKPPMVRPSTGKKPKTTQQRPQTAKTRQPAQSYKQFIASQSNRANRSNRNNQQISTQQSAQRMQTVRKQSARKRNGSKKSQLNTISHMPQEDQGALLQQLIAQKQESGVMPVFNEEFLNQLSEEQLQQVIQQQQAVIQQNPNSQMGSKSAQLLPPRPKRSRSAKRPQSSGVLTDNQNRNNARARAQIYSQNIPTISSGRRRTSKPASSNREKKASKGKRRKVQPGQGILLNNFFPALESGGNHSAHKPNANMINMNNAQEQYAAQQAALQAQQEAQDQEQIINEVPPEEEEGESQDIVNSRMQQSSTTMQEQAQIQHQQTLQLVQAVEGLEPDQLQEFLEQLSPEQQEQLLLHQQQMQMQQDEDEEEDDQQQEFIPVDENGQPIQNMMGDDDNGQFVDQNESPSGQFDSTQMHLSEEQLVELLKNADQLNPEQQAQLQQILKTRWKKEIKSQKEKQYSNIYNILTENVAKAKVRLSKLADSPAKKNQKHANEDRDTVERINRQKKEYETLLKRYGHEQKVRNKGKEAEQKRIERQIAREMKLKSIREKKFEEDLINQQKSLMYKRNAQQVRLCQKVYRLASNLEKNKLLDEKKNFFENQSMKKTQKKLMVDGIENFYKDKINMLRERIETEKFERKIAQNAQVEALSRMKRELDLSKKKEIQKYLQLLKQEDQKYDFQSSNLHKLEHEIVRLYKK